MDAGGQDFVRPGGRDGRVAGKDLKMGIEKRLCRVFLYPMNATIANGGIPDIRAQMRLTTERQIEWWFDLMDRVLDIHRSNFVFREPTTKELEEHKTFLKECIRYSLMMNAVIADPETNAPELASRLQVRIQQLQDAYNLFHDTSLSDEGAKQVLQSVFPE